MAIDSALEALVRKRAEHRCEYCHFPEHLAEVPFQIDHILARQHGGTTEAENLALACAFCNRHKGPNLSGVDPITRRIALLFNPRTQRWNRHFRWDGAILVGKTAAGRSTVHTLRINRHDVRLIRELLIVEGTFLR